VSIDILNELAALTLNKYNVKAKYAIICLDQKMWRKVAKERVNVDENAYRQTNELLESGVYIDRDTAKKHRESMDIEKQITTEYNRVLKLDEQLNSTSIIFNIKNMRISKVFKEKLPSMYKLYVKNKNKDFLILLNIYLLSSLQTEETYLSVVHETLHFVETCLGYKFTYMDVEKKAGETVRGFLASMQPGETGMSRFLLFGDKKSYACA